MKYDLLYEPDFIFNNETNKYWLTFYERTRKGSSNDRWQSPYLLKRSFRSYHSIRNVKLLGYIRLPAIQLPLFLYLSIGRQVGKTVQPIKTTVTGIMQFGVPMY